jgi:fibronectin type 3 domain-containing protein
LTLNIGPQPPTINGKGLNAANQPQIFWVPSASGGVVGYNIYRSTTSGGGYTNVGSVGAGVATFTDANAASGTTFFYVLTAVASGNLESAFSNEVSISVP